MLWELFAMVLAVDAPHTFTHAPHRATRKPIETLQLPPRTFRRRAMCDAKPYVSHRKYLIFVQVFVSNMCVSLVSARPFKLITHMTFVCIFLYPLDFGSPRSVWVFFARPFRLRWAQILWINVYLRRSCNICFWWRRTQQCDVARFSPLGGISNSSDGDSAVANNETLYVHM